MVETLRVPHERLGAILEAWRDGYAEPIAEYSSISFETVLGYFNQLIANIQDPFGYAVLMVPVVSAHVAFKSNT